MKTKQTQYGEIKIDDDVFEELMNRGFLINARAEGTMRWKSNVRVVVSVNLARFIMGMTKGNGLVVDHINGDSLDNRRENLRVCTQGENIRNCGKRCRIDSDNKKKFSSKYKGVIFLGRRDSLKSKWKAEITVNKVVIPLGHYKSEEFAGYIYDYAAYALHGQYARTNGLYTPPSPEQFGLRESA